MSKLLTALKYEGLMYSISKIWKHVIGNRKRSLTIFVRCQNFKKTINKNCFSVKLLEEADIELFGNIKFFEHIDGNDYVCSENQMILLV